MEPNSLAHYGVLGMKWGVRKARKMAGNSVRNVYKARKRIASNVRTTIDNNPKLKNTIKATAIFDSALATAALAVVGAKGIKKALSFAEERKIANSVARVIDKTGKTLVYISKSGRKFT